MGTTLALTGAYNLAGSLLPLIQRPDDSSITPESCFAAYESATRPIVAKAQKLVPGAPHIMAPETSWGIWILHALVYTMWCLRVQEFAERFAGPPANAVPVREYGFRQLDEWHGWRGEKGEV